MSRTFGVSFEYKVIYVFSINDRAHAGLLKIGDATLDTATPIDALAPNSRELNQAARKRIDSYTQTAATAYRLEHTELAVRTVLDKNGVPQIKAFRDHDVHNVLKNSGIERKVFDDAKGREWFKVDLATAKKAIDAVKQCRPHLTQSEITEIHSPIVFRPEQEDAISRTLRIFKTGNSMLWNAKMRFGKTLCALEVVKRSGFAKTIIATHRPVVNDGWFKDFGNIFFDTPDTIYGSKSNGDTVEGLVATGKHFVYFASIQDLRGSATVGGKFEKNDAVFTIDWDCVIVDEAHEGTTTALGEDVINGLVKADSDHPTKFLALSGTPFNILGNYNDNSIYTWDYVMEQKSKAEWDKNHFGDSNPYEELPELSIYTYDLGKLINDARYVELEDKAFNFREFFRTWTGRLEQDHAVKPEAAKVGDFVHEADVLSFLNLLTKSDPDSNYPYSNEEFRALFQHSLWMVPGVREARALSRMLRAHAIFGNGTFEIVNVAGDGDEEEKPEEALSKVRRAIANAGEYGYTITLSCGKLTTGVTIPEWTAVFMLAGSFSTSAANYLQTIFRVQSPCNRNGRIKQRCYVFDFAPDRTLKMVAEAAAISTKAGKTGNNDRVILGEFLNYCPVIAIDGTVMRPYDTNNMLQQLKRAYAERAVQNGFDDTSLYDSQALLTLEGLDIEEFNKLKGIIGSTKAAPKAREIDINSQGFTDEEYEELNRIERKPKRERTPEEIQKLEESKKKNKLKQDAISILRGISIRMPLLIYGADVPMGEDVTLDKLVRLVDEASWTEFMPKGVDKRLFRKFMKYYDPEVFVAAGRRIRNTVLSADNLPPMERVRKIADLMLHFKNPDNETVRDNVFVICKTQMAKAITRRTLVGFKDAPVNAHYFDDLINKFKNQPDLFKKKVLKPSYWGKDGSTMQFDAIVGNPPYQVMDGGNGASAQPVYQYFISNAKSLSPKYISMITPSRWFSGGKNLDDFRNDMLTDKRLSVIIDYVDNSALFDNVSIPGGLNYFLWDASHDGLCHVVTVRGTESVEMDRNLSEFDIFVRNNASIRIINRISGISNETMESVVSTRNVFGIPTDEKGTEERSTDADLHLVCSQNSNQLTMRFVNPEKVEKNHECVNKWKVVIGRCVPRGGEKGVDPKVGYRVTTTVHIFAPDVVFTDTYLMLSSFDEREQAINFAKYMTCKLPRFLLHETYSSMNITKSNFRFVPYLDYSKEWTDAELYARYECTQEEIDLIEGMIRPLEFVVHDE